MCFNFLKHVLKWIPKGKLSPNMEYYFHRCDEKNKKSKLK